jgi:beta-glucosidase
MTLGVEPPAPPDHEELDRAVALARDADAAVLVVGTSDEIESEGFDRASLALPGRQDELVHRVAAANPARSWSSTAAARSPCRGGTRCRPSC